MSPVLRNVLKQFYRLNKSILANYTLGNIFNMVYGDPVGEEKRASG